MINGQGRPKNANGRQPAKTENKVLRKLYPFDDTIKEVPERYHMTQVEIAAYLLNKRGAEGETAHSENGISRSYEDGDVPSSLLRDIVPYAGVVK